MKDKDFFHRVLGLEEPWSVTEVKLDLPGKRVDVRVVLREGIKWVEDGALLPIAGYEEREWRHLDTMQLETVLRARVPRVRYPDGTTRMVAEGGIFQGAGHTGALPAGSGWKRPGERSGWGRTILRSPESRAIRPAGRGLRYRGREPCHLRDRVRGCKPSSAPSAVRLRHS